MYKKMTHEEANKLTESKDVIVLDLTLFIVVSSLVFPNIKQL